MGEEADYLSDQGMYDDSLWDDGWDFEYRPGRRPIYSRLKIKMLKRETGKAWQIEHPDGKIQWYPKSACTLIWPVELSCVQMATNFLLGHPLVSMPISIRVPDWLVKRKAAEEVRQAEVRKRANKAPNGMGADTLELISC